MPQHKLLVANRGEIALRILRTAKAEGLSTVAIYTPSDALSPHVTFADEAVALQPDSDSSESEATAYLSIPRIISICRSHNVTLLHPGYGFLSENAGFARAVRDAGVVWLGPKAQVMEVMGRKHVARRVAREAGVVCVPGSGADSAAQLDFDSEGSTTGLVEDERAASEVAERIGYPVMIKASAGGGGMGMAICEHEGDLGELFGRVKRRAQALFNDGSVFLERYFPAARHIEIQVFGNGAGDAVCLGERECSIQRRHQKIIEETPSPYLDSRPELRARMYDAAVRLAQHVRYGSAGTVEFLVDDERGEFFFLEMNTRIQVSPFVWFAGIPDLQLYVEHAITEAVHPGLDLVKLMIQQGLAEAEGLPGLAATSIEMQQSTYDALLQEGRQSGAGWSMEARVYAENPAVEFRPCPGVLQYVRMPSEPWLRVDTWISTGTKITSFFDSLLAKIVVTAPTRLEAISRLVSVLGDTQIQGPTNNVEYLKNILDHEVFRSGEATTTFLNTLEYHPRAMTVLAASVEMTVQDFPGRDTRLGIPRSGPMDNIAFRAANILVDNPVETEGLEIIVLPGAPSAFRFHVPTVVAVTGKHVSGRVGGQDVGMWRAFEISAGGELLIETDAKEARAGGWRTYLAVRGGFPGIPRYLGSKSTSMGLGGYQGRSLIVGDELVLAKECGSTDGMKMKTISPSLIPSYPSHFIIHVLAGPQDDEEFVTPAGISQFYATRWRVSPSSNRLGIRLESSEKIEWARTNGGTGGSHPSNILDNGYAIGSVNMNGDTPVLFTQESPDMGGYLCMSTVVTADMWKVGQLYPGCTLEFRRVSWDDAMILLETNTEWLQAFRDQDNSRSSEFQRTLEEVTPSHSKLFITARNPTMVVRQAGDSAVLIEYGDMRVDFHVRARIHALETELKDFKVDGILAFCPCVRSTMFYYDPTIISQAAVLALILKADGMLPDSMNDMIFPGRRLTFPIVLDDQWSREALQRYMGSIRDKAVYLPSNVDYLARNNGFEDKEDVLGKLVVSDWLVFGVGFYLACPFLIPIDPRCRIVAQKMNPSRTYTPQGAVGIAGVVAAIYPIVSPGGYMLFGRTLPAWQEWGNGADFEPERPWLLRPFDQVKFEVVGEEEYLEIEKRFNAGQYRFKIEDTQLSMAEYSAFNASIADEIAQFEARQAESVAREEAREKVLLEEWEQRRKSDIKPAAFEEIHAEGSAVITSPLLGTVWKICLRPGDVIPSVDTTVMILEAMKTEIPVKAGEANVGRKVVRWGEGVREGGRVEGGDVLVVLE
ncbi:allophanate hydrolase subunit 2-domain-containing protein [Roridomyces roridus]|uniref:Allophanate hydrolase subunit 2-domain-containing protein n=1 Tax=Roridomyces roridus TaxID=1738132 RepID=A0AAD7C8L1_9AGAR|nr:allophanate hydrolase subunit 2-domain-containing protein [Roridomyces roridus]